MARKIVISPDRRLYIATELDKCDFSRDNAKYAEYWLKWGDWSMKGNDPTLTLDDFFPSAQQHSSGWSKKHIQQTPNRSAFEPVPKQVETAIMTDGERRDMAIWIIRDKEPAWGFKLEVDWIRAYDKEAWSL